MDNDYTALRAKMVENQLVRRGISDQKVIEAMRKIPRHLFVDATLAAHAYEDHPLKIDKNQTISQPYMVALMTQCLNPDSSKTVLEVGTGSGYQTAVLAETCKHVFTMEVHEELCLSAQDLLNRLGYANVTFSHYDGSRGWPDPGLCFDRIMVTAAAPGRMDHLFECLLDGGRLVVPEGNLTRQILKLYIKKDGRISEEQVCACVFVPLVGRSGWDRQGKKAKHE